MSAPPARIRPSIRSSTSSGLSSRASGGIISARPPARWICGDVADGEQRGALIPDAPLRPGSRPCRCRSQDGGSLILVSASKHPDSAAPRTLPLAVFGSSGAKSTIRGYLYGAVSRLTWSWRSAASSALGANPSRSTTTARTTAPRSSSGAPTTAASATASMRDERRLDLERPDPVARGDDHVVGAPLEVQVAVLVLMHPVARVPGSRRGAASVVEVADEEGRDRWSGRRARARRPRP